MTTFLFIIVLFLLVFTTLLIQGLYLTHRLQQLGYSNFKFIKWLQSYQYREVFIWNIFELLLPLFIILLLFFNIKNLPIYKYITSSIMLITFFWKIIQPFLKKWINFKAKVPLVFTARVKRLLFTYILIAFSSLFFSFLLLITPFDEFTLQTWSFFRLNAFVLFISLVAPIVLIVSNFINLPFEKVLFYLYFTKAKTKIKKSKVITIGITGSYGKTSTKFFLSTILNEKFPTFNTPASYNTPMGISKIINDKNLYLNKYKFFIAEMGADKKGDITTLCKLAKPDFAIVTAIDIQHLETFGSIENIINEKLSLFNNLKDDGFGVYNYDSKLLRENIYRVKAKNPLYCYSIFEENRDKVDIYAKNITHTKNGLSFTVCFKNKELTLTVPLLGKHNVSNMLAAIFTAKKLGLNDNEILKGVEKIKPVEHRLQLINSPLGITIIDDAFNSNPQGAYEALQVLKEINGHKKIIVTPGMIGLGEKEDEINKIFGNQISEVADIVILVGKRKTKAIYEGLLEKNYDKNNIIITSSLNEAKNKLQQVVTKDDVILFENDLPDVYNE